MWQSTWKMSDSIKIKNFKYTNWNFSISLISFALCFVFEDNNAEAYNLMKIFFHKYDFAGETW